MRPTAVPSGSRLGPPIRRRSARATHILVAAAGLALSAGQVAHATTYYWDLNGNTPGAGSAPTGTWDAATSTNWTTDSTGSSATISITSASTDDLFFVAGPAIGSGDTAYTVTVSGTQLAQSLNFQSSGAATFSGGTAINLGSGGINLPQFAFGSTAQGAVTISTPIAAQANQTWTTNAAAALTIGPTTAGSTAVLTLDTSTVSIGGSGNVTINGIVAKGATGGGGITMNGAGTLTLAGTAASTFTGPITVNSGTVSIGTLGQIGSASSLSINGGTLKFTAGIGNTTPINIGASGGTINVLVGTTTSTGKITGSGPLSLTGTQIFASNASSSTYNGTITVNSGVTLVPQGSSVGGNTTGPFGTGTIVFNGGSMRATTTSGTYTLGNPITLAADASVVTSSPAQPLIFSGNVTLSATATGQTRTFTNSSTNTVSLGPIIDGPNTPAVKFAGSGTTTLTGTDTFTTATTVSAGTLLVNGNLSGSGVSVTGGTLGGTGGTVTPLITVANGATLLAGNGSAASGTLTIAGGVTMSATSSLKFALGSGLTHSTLARTGGTATFAANQQVALVNVGSNATTGTYDNIITGLTSDPGVSTWTIANSPGFAGTFSFDGANVDLTVTAVPEPVSFGLFAVGAAGLLLRRRRASGAC